MAFKADGPKRLQIAGYERVALMFYWPRLGRPVRLREKATKQSPERSAQEFLDRSFEWE
jgi:pyridoxine/pyridoxamine 5'-phosphate oxidase